MRFGKPWEEVGYDEVGCQGYDDDPAERDPGIAERLEPMGAGIVVSSLVCFPGAGNRGEWTCWETDGVF